MICTLVIKFYQLNYERNKNKTVESMSTAQTQLASC